MHAGSIFVKCNHELARMEHILSGNCFSVSKFNAHLSFVARGKTSHVRACPRSIYIKRLKQRNQPRSPAARVQLERPRPVIKRRFGRFSACRHRPASQSSKPRLCGVARRGAARCGSVVKLASRRICSVSVTPATRLRVGEPAHRAEPTSITPATDMGH